MCNQRATATSLFPELLVSFERNPHIQSFGVDASFLEQHRHLFLESKLSFHQLIMLTKLDMNLVYNLINDLHKRDFFKELMVRDSHLPFSCALQYPSYTFNLKFLILSVPPPRDASVPVLESIRVLSLRRAKVFPENISKQIATNFTNLLLITIEGNLEDIAVFVGIAPKLEQIVFITFTDVDMWEVWILNEARKRLVGAQKIIILLKRKVLWQSNWQPNPIRV